jgi:hypothetical protein
MEGPEGKGPGLGLSRTDLKGARRPNGEWGYSARRHTLGHERLEAVSPARGAVLTDLQSSIDCQ